MSCTSNPLRYAASPPPFYALPLRYVANPPPLFALLFFAIPSPSFAVLFLRMTETSYSSASWKCFAIPLPCCSVQSRFQSMLFNTKPPPRIALPPLFSARPFNALRRNSTALLRIAIPLLLLLCYSSHIRRPAFLTIPTLRLALPQLIGSALCLNSAFFSLSLPRIAVFSFALSLRTAPFLYIALSAYPIHGSLRTASPYHFKPSLYCSKAVRSLQFRFSSKPDYAIA